MVLSGGKFNRSFDGSFSLFSPIVKLGHLNHGE
jgi:hypothetical protein